MLEVEFNQEVGIDSVIRTVRTYQRQLQVHPLSAVMRSPRVPRGLLVEFASLQYIDSVMWVPMLALMKDRVAHPRLVKALTDNLLCEAGARHVSHVSLCKDFVESVGGRPYFGDALRWTLKNTHSGC